MIDRIIQSGLLLLPNVSRVLIAGGVDIYSNNEKLYIYDIQRKNLLSVVFRR